MKPPHDKGSRNGSAGPPRDRGGDRRRPPSVRGAAEGQPGGPHRDQAARDAAARNRRPADAGSPRLSLTPRPPEPRGQEPRGQEARGHEPRGPEPRPHGARPPASARDHRPNPAPKGTVWLYGLHAVEAALANPARRLRRLLLTEDAETAILARFPRPWPIQPERIDRARLDQTLGRDAVHQGAGLLTDPLNPPSLAQALDRPGPVILLDQVTDPRNVGAILRSAAAFGAAAVITQERNAPDETGALAKAASGALERVPLFKAVNISRTIVALKAAGLWCIGLDAAGPALSGAAFADRRVALVLGAEGEGLRRLTRETCDELAGIGQSRAMESLNVSAAAAIALYEVQRKG